MKKLNTLFFALILTSGLMAQTVTSVTPNIGHEGGTVNMTVVCTGMNFNASQYTYTINFFDSASGGTYTNFADGNATVVNSTTITQAVAIPSLVYPLGPYTLQIVNNNTGTSATALGKFYIEGANGITEIGVPGFKAYPVPATGTLYVEAASGQQLTDISLISLSGQQVLKQSGNGNQETLDIHGISAGVYILSVTDRTGAVSHTKITIE